MKRESVRKLLRNYDTIEFTKHAEIQCKQRDISKKEVEYNIINPKNLIEVKVEGELKYKLYFKVSNARTLVVRVVLCQSIKVITTYIIINKLQKSTWLKWKK